MKRESFLGLNGTGDKERCSLHEECCSELPDFGGVWRSTSGSNTT